jgi:hypothetical protein
LGVSKGKILENFYRKPMIERIGSKIIVGMNSLTPEQAREVAKELMTLAEEAEIAANARQANNPTGKSALTMLIEGVQPRAPIGSVGSIIAPTNSDIRTYGSTPKPVVPATPAAARRTGTPIVIKGSVAPVAPSK